MRRIAEIQKAVHDRLDLEQRKTELRQVAEKSARHVPIFRGSSLLIKDGRDAFANVINNRLRLA